MMTAGARCYAREMVGDEPSLRSCATPVAGNCTSPIEISSKLCNNPFAAVFPGGRMRAFIMDSRRPRV